MTNLVEIDHLNIRFTGERTVYAVNDLSLTLGDGEVLGLLGESGSGKSVTLRALMRLLPTSLSAMVGAGIGATGASTASVPATAASQAASAGPRQRIASR